jgi:hypothetical protein
LDQRLLRLDWPKACWPEFGQQAQVANGLHVIVKNYLGDLKEIENHLTWFFVAKFYETFYGH